MPASRLLVAALLVLGACDPAAAPDDRAPAATAPPVPGVAFTTDAATYRAGAPIGLALANGTDAELTTGVLECAQLQRWSGAAWAAAPEGNDRACIEIARILAPGDRLAGRVTVRVPDGPYRFLHWVTTPGASGTAVTTDAFRIE